MRTLKSLDALVALVDDLSAKGLAVFVRYSRGPVADRRAAGSTNWQTGKVLGGLSCNPLNVPDWWQRGTRGYVAMQVRDYAYMRFQGGAGTRGWVLTGTESGRGADNEPLVTDWTPVAYLADAVIEEAEALGN